MHHAYYAHRAWFSSHDLVLQASQRAGGRVNTVTSKGGLPIELGASWIHGASSSNPISQLVSQFGLKTAVSSDDQFYLTNGTGTVVTYKYVIEVMRYTGILFTFSMLSIYRHTYVNVCTNHALYRHACSLHKLQANSVRWLPQSCKHCLQSIL